MIGSTTDYSVEEFLVDDKPVMMSVTEVLQILNKINKIKIIGKGELCPTTVSVANIITQNMLNGRTQIDKILVDSEILDDGRLISIIEIIITKIDSQ